MTAQGTGKTVADDSEDSAKKSYIRCKQDECLASHIGIARPRLLRTRLSVAVLPAIQYEYEVLHVIWYSVIAVVTRCGTVIVEEWGRSSSIGCTTSDRRSPLANRRVESWSRRAAGSRCRQSYAKQRRFTGRRGARRHLVNHEAVKETGGVRN